MLTKIHFDSNLAIIAPAGDAEAAGYKERKGVLWIEEATAGSVRKAIDFALSGKDRVVVLSSSDTANVFEGFNRALFLIRAAGGLIRDGDYVLLIFRKGKWDLPKGKLDPGEDLQDCALREINEETGLTHLTAESFLLKTYHTYQEKRRHVLKESNWYLVRGDRSDALMPQMEEDIAQCIWVHVNDLGRYMTGAHESIVDVFRYAKLVP